MIEICQFNLNKENITFSLNYNHRVNGGSKWTLLKVRKCLDVLRVEKTTKFEECYTLEVEVRNI